MATMKKDELAMFTIKPEYAYGERGSPPKIPPGSTLNFEIELFSWKGKHSVQVFNKKINLMNFVIRVYNVHCTVQ